MQAPHRNQLVWLRNSGWEQVCERQDSAWDAEAQTILQHWRRMQLPLVVCMQRVPHNPATISLGLPAPNRWNRRKLALEVLPQAIERTGEFPLLKQLAPVYINLPAMQKFLDVMQVHPVQLQVYGSFGWQFLTGMDYLRPTSDLDLRAQVPDHTMAREMAGALGALQLPLRVDGELAFADGRAIAWREYLQWVDGKVNSLLVKSRTSVQLMNGNALAALDQGCFA